MLRQARGSSAGKARLLTALLRSIGVPARLVEESLRKLVPVSEVKDVTELPTVDRDLALIRVSCASADRAEVAQLADIFRGRIVDVAPDSVIVEVTGDGAKVDGLVELLRPRGILEMVRTGKVAMLRGVTPAA